MRRAIADVRVLVAHKKVRPFSECDQLYLDRVRLGFASVVDEVTAAGAHARYCRQIGLADEAMRCALAAVEKIDRTREGAQPPVPAELEAVIRQMSTP